MLGWIGSLRAGRSPRRSEAAVDLQPSVGLGPHLPLVADDFPLVLCWSPKSGCTTTLRWFLFQTGLLAESKATCRRPHLYRREWLYRQPGYEGRCRAALVDGSRPVVKVVRDPATRAVSSYIHVLRSALTQNPAPWNAVQRWKDAAGIGGPAGLSLEQMLLYALSPRLDGEWIDAHCAEQWNPCQDRHVTEFVRVEELSDALRGFERRFGLPPAPLDELAHSRHHRRVSAHHGWPADAARFVAPAGAIARLGMPPTSLFLDERTRDLIRTAYRRDYVAYGAFYGAEAGPAPVPGTDLLPLRAPRSAA